MAQKNGRGLGRQGLLIIDEAYGTQASTVRKIVQGLGLGRYDLPKTDGVKELIPHPESESLLIGLSGTGGGLKNYRVSGQLSILDALEGGWIREMNGERVYPKGSQIKMKGGQGERMIWWQATEANARELATIYLAKMGPLEKSLVYVPTIQHGELFQRALEELSGEKPKQSSSFVHSHLRPEQIEQRMDRWEVLGGALISVRMLSTGFRGGGVDGVFHTYQSNSEELFAQRTGRAWGISSKDSPLFVLEATWDRARYSKLAKLLGLVDYPRDRFAARPGIASRIRRLRQRQALEQELKEGIEQRAVESFFGAVPILATWRETFGALVRRRGGYQKLQEETGLAAGVLKGLGMGALPLSMKQVDALGPALGGRLRVLRLFVESWEEVLAEAHGGERQLSEGFLKELSKWQRRGGGLEEMGRDLEEILAREFQTRKQRYVRTDPKRLRQAFQRAAEEAGQNDQKASFRGIADRAHEIYVTGLAETEHPSKGTFRKMVARGKRGRPEILSLIEQMAGLKK